VDIRELLRDLPVFDRPLPTNDPAAAPSAPLPLSAAWLAAWLAEAAAAGVVEPQGAADRRHVRLRDRAGDAWSRCLLWP
jgi:pyridoxamine 5'-phosphate oxidase